jgi:hypothetical protein
MVAEDLNPLFQFIAECTPVPKGITGCSIQALQSQLLLAGVQLYPLPESSDEDGIRSQIHSPSQHHTQSRRPTLITCTSKMYVRSGRGIARN